MQNIDDAVARAIDLISLQDIWEEKTVIRGCRPAGNLCFVITCKHCGGGDRLPNGDIDGTPAPC